MYILKAYQMHFLCLITFAKWIIYRQSLDNNLCWWLVQFLLWSFWVSDLCVTDGNSPAAEEREAKQKKHLWGHKLSKHRWCVFSVYKSNLWISQLSSPVYSLTLAGGYRENSADVFWIKSSHSESLIWKHKITTAIVSWFSIRTQQRLV